jgi:F-type H+-transporting ATPase subunit epsilon
MAGRQINLDIVTPERRVFQADVEMFIAPGSQGYLGIMAGHIPLITSLDIGVAKIKTEDGETKVAIGGGFMEVQPNRILVLADTAEIGKDIDVSRAQAAKARAEERIEMHKNGGSLGYEIDLVRARVALQKALTRIKAADASESWESDSAKLRKGMGD